MQGIQINKINDNFYRSLEINLPKPDLADNEILVHVNEGTDGTIDYLKNNNYKYTLSPENDGLCIGCNKVSKLCKYDLR